MSIKGRVFGGLSLAKKLKDIGEQGEKAQRQTIAEGVLLIHETAVKSIQDNSDGDIAIRYNPLRAVRVSNAGDPPNTDTGRLVQSIKFEILNNGLKGLVGTNLKYGAWLEFGTKTMAARPWLQPAVQVAAEQIAKIAGDNLVDALESATGKKLRVYGSKAAKLTKKAGKSAAKAEKKLGKKAKKAKSFFKKSAKSATRSAKQFKRSAKKSFKGFKKQLRGKKR